MSELTYQQLVELLDTFEAENPLSIIEKQCLQSRLLREGEYSPSETSRYLTSLDCNPLFKLTDYGSCDIII